MIKSRLLANNIAAIYFSNVHSMKISTRYLKSTNIVNKFNLSLTNNNLIVKNKYGFSNELKNNTKLDAYFRLCRWDKPIGAMLLYWPTAWGVCIGSAGFANPYLLVIFLMGSWTSRSAGCIINDYFDRDVDKHVQRTKNRPLASGEVTLKQAAALLFGNLCISLNVLFHMTPISLIATFGFFGLSSLYPLAKRYTNYPQFVLALCFNSGVIIGCLTANPTIFIPSMFPLYASGIAWTMIYDTVYAYQDIDDDLKIGVKSTAVTWRNNNPKIIMQRFGYIMLLCHAMLPIFQTEFLYSTPLMLGCDLYLIKLIRQIDLSKKAACGQFFIQNNKIGAGIFFSLLLYTVIKAWKNPKQKNTDIQK